MIPPPYLARKRSIWGFQPYRSAGNQFLWWGRVCLSDEDVDVSDRNDSESSRVLYTQRLSAGMMGKLES
jgi:hypothetical protein